MGASCSRKSNGIDDEATKDLLSETSEPRAKAIVVNTVPLTKNQTREFSGKAVQLTFVPTMDVEYSNHFCQKRAACLVQSDSVATLERLQAFLGNQPMVLQTTEVGVYVLIFPLKSSTDGTCTAVFRLTRMEGEVVADVTHLDGGKPAGWSAMVNLNVDQLEDGAGNWQAKDVIMEEGHFGPMIHGSEAVLHGGQDGAVNVKMRAVWWSDGDADGESTLYECALLCTAGRYWSKFNEPKINDQYTFPIVTKIRGVFLTTHLSHVTLTVLSKDTEWTLVMIKFSDGTQTAIRRAPRG